MCTKLIPIALVLSVLITPDARAQEHRGNAMHRDTTMTPHPQMMQSGVLGISQARQGSGTAWQPDVSTMHALHATRGSWNLMFHGNVFLQYIDAGSDRAGGSQGSRDQFGSVNWFMGMVGRSVGAGEVQARAMLSLEPLTVGRCGYPDLLATGELCRGEPLHDRQHPHDLFMEVAAEYRRGVSPDLAISLYGGPAAEPALGPVAYPHRASAMTDLMAPIAHHWQDATHIAFGVVTAGLFGRKWKIEGSAFNGREPDEERYDFDLGPLDSYSGRIWFLPTDRVAMQVSLGQLNEAEPAHDGSGRQDITRATASLAYSRPLGSEGQWATTLVWGQNRESDQSTNAVLAETTLGLDERNAFSGRAEVVEKTGDDLALDDTDASLGERIFTVGKTSVGYTHQFVTGSFLTGIGAQVAVSFVPNDLERVHGSRVPVGFAVFASLRPRPMRMEGHRMNTMPAPPGMQHGAAADMMRGVRLLSLSDVETVLVAAGADAARADTIHQPFWTVPSVVYQMQSAHTRNAALHVNVYDTHDAAAADAAMIHPSGAIGTTIPTWVAPPHFFTVSNLLITLLLDTAQDPSLMNAVRHAIESLGGRRVEAAPPNPGK